MQLLCLSDNYESCISCDFCNECLCFLFLNELLFAGLALLLLTQILGFNINLVANCCDSYDY